MKKLILLFIFIFIICFNFPTEAQAYNSSDLPEVLYNDCISFFGKSCNNKSSALNYFSDAVGTNNYDNYILTYNLWGTDGNGYTHYFLIFQFTSNSLADESATRTFCDNNPSYTYVRPGYVYNSSSRFSSFLCISNNEPYVNSGSFNCKVKVIDYGSYISFVSINGNHNPSARDSSFIISSNLEEISTSFNESIFDDSLGKLNIKTSRYLNTSTHIYHDFFTIDTTTTTDVDVTQPGYGIKCQVLFYGDNDYLYDTEYFNLTDYRFNYDWKSKTFENLSLPSLPEPDKFSQYRIFLFPYKEENGTIKRGSFSSVSYGDYVSGVSTSNTREVGVHRVGVTRPDGSTKELDSFVKPLPVISGKGLTLSDKDTINNKYVYEYHYPDEPDEITNNYISNNITNPDSIVDIPGNENVSDFDFGSIKAFLTGLYNFLFKLSKVLILWLGLPPFLATVLNLGLYVIVFLIFGSLFKKLF